MNPQYIHQAQQPQQPGPPPHFGDPHDAPPYDGLNPNIPQNMKSPVNPQQYPPHKMMQGNAPPPPLPLSSPQNAYYNYNAPGDTLLHSPAPPPPPPASINPATVTNQMSNMTLNNPPPQNFSPMSGPPTSNVTSPPIPGGNSMAGPPPPSPMGSGNNVAGPPPTSNIPAGNTLAGPPMNSMPTAPPSMNGFKPPYHRSTLPPEAAQRIPHLPQNSPQQQQQQQPTPGIPNYPQAGPISSPPSSTPSLPPTQPQVNNMSRYPGVPQQPPAQLQAQRPPPVQGNINTSSLPPQKSMEYPPTSQQRPPTGPFMGQQQPPIPQNNLSRPPMPGSSVISSQPGVGAPQGSYNAYQSQGPQQMPGPPPATNIPAQNQSPMMMQQRPPPVAGSRPPLPLQPGQMPNYQQPGYPMNNQQPQDPYSAQRNQYPPQQQQPGVNMPGSMSPGFQANQAQQAKRLDPDTMPSPIQVMQDDQRVRGGEFLTNQKGLVPPFVTTKFTVVDQGNASPRFIRSTIYTVPTTTDIMKQTGVPFGLIINPMAKVHPGEHEPPIVDMGSIGPVRCIRCKAYMSPFMQFIDAGRRFQCLFCKATTEVPSEYFQHLDHTGQRMDRHERPELMLGTYEFIATKDYCRNNTFPKAPAIIFIIDVSYNNVRSGLINLICDKMKGILKNLPRDTYEDKTKMKVGFITYSNTVHFYNISSNLTQPQMMVVGDVNEIFMPLLDGFLCDAEESEIVIDSLMAQLPTMFSETRETETILAPAIQAGLEALKASDCTGKLVVFHSSLPIAEAPGKLKNRDDRKVLGTDKEKTVLSPQNNVYNNLGQDCVGAGCSVDMYLFNNSYIDIATIGQVCRLSGGEIYKYTYFQADTDGDRLIHDIIHNISRPIAFDAVMRVRTSTGVRPTDFYGHFYMSNTTDLEIAGIDCNKAVAIEIKHDDKLTDEDGVYIQVALLYTSCSGIRRLRIINLSLRTSSQMAELYRTCDPDAIINFFSKQSVFKLIESSPKAIKDNLITRCATILGAYRKHCALPFSASRLVLPECMKLLPLYVNCLLKSDAISGGADMTIDDKSYVIMAVSTMPIYTSVIYFYPRLLPLHDIDPHSDELPQQLRCSIDKFTDDGAFLLENGIHMFLWLGYALSPEWIQAVFGTPVVDTDRTSLPVLDTPLNKRVRDVIAKLRAEAHHCMRLTLVRQRDKLEMVLRHFLVEDRGNDSNPGYVDFLCHMHKEIKTLLSQ